MNRSSPRTGAQNLALGPRFCPRFNRSCRQPVNLASGGRDYVRGAISWARRPVFTGVSLKPTVIFTELSEPSVSLETANRRISSDMIESLRENPDCTTQHVIVTNMCLPQECVIISRPYILQVVMTPVLSCLGCGRLTLATLGQDRRARN